MSVQCHSRDFWGYRDELSILDGLVLKGTRIIVPRVCHEEVLAKLHEGHFGIERTKLRAERQCLLAANVQRD